ncbi:DMT family transporter [Planomicrobium sp. Y74]|uniref:DMT family transporter n=1 Tax=Planomicrobium sp. Y74 TaxID=2478977 RepID=UPI000EF5093D|nr:DMT family transporter [Planomicrobium sp. Y74]RLQ90040.1 DMT family transporter [Planomicrobium sp. Y74]
MKGILFALLGGFFLTFQSVANATISSQIGSWQAATMTQLTGFVLAIFIVLIIRDRSYRQLPQVSPLYASGGMLAAIVLFSNMTAVHIMGVTLTIAIFLIAQLVLAIAIDGRGWFDMSQKRIGKTQIVGVLMMIAGVIILKL